MSDLFYLVSRVKGSVKRVQQLSALLRICQHQLKTTIDHFSFVITSTQVMTRSRLEENFVQAYLFAYSYSYPLHV